MHNMPTLTMKHIGDPRPNHLLWGVFQGSICSDTLHPTERQVNRHVPAVLGVLVGRARLDKPANVVRQGPLRRPWENNNGDQLQSVNTYEGHALWRRLYINQCYQLRPPLIIKVL